MTAVNQRQTGRQEKSGKALAYLDSVTPGKFAEDVTLALFRRRMTKAELAQLIGRPRPTVSEAINNGRFRHVREQIAAALSLS